MLLRSNRDPTDITIDGTLQYDFWKRKPHREILQVKFDSVSTEKALTGLRQVYLDALMNFPHLATLCLPEGDFGAPDSVLCGGTFDGPNGKRAGRVRTQQSIERTEFTGNVVLASLPNLKYLCIGNDHAEITRDAQGSVNIVWPWTGRVNETLYEEWPEFHVDDHLWERPYPFRYNGDDGLRGLQELWMRIRIVDLAEQCDYALHYGRRREYALISLSADDKSTCADSDQE